MLKLHLVQNLPNRSQIRIQVVMIVKLTVTVTVLLTLTNVMRTHVHVHAVVHALVQVQVVQVQMIRVQKVVEPMANHKIQVKEVKESTVMPVTKQLNQNLSLDLIKEN